MSGHDPWQVRQMLQYPATLNNEITARR